MAQLEEQIEAAENEIDPDEEDEEDEYEPVDDAKYRSTAEGLPTPEVQKEMEEFRKRLHERGEASRAEAAKVAAEDLEKSIKKRREGVFDSPRRRMKKSQGRRILPTQKTQQKQMLGLRKKQILWTRRILSGQILWTRKTL